jgi:hypothetical protein
MTRKRTRENLVQTVCDPCSYCQGKGYVLSSRSVAYRILRAIRRDLSRLSGRRVALSVAPSVAELLLGEDKEALAALSADVGRALEVRARPGMHHEQFEVEALDEGPPVAVSLRWLGEPEAGLEDDLDLGDDADEDTTLPPYPAAGSAEAPGEAAADPDAPRDEAPAGPLEPAWGAAAGEGEAAAAAGPVDGPAESRILPRSQESGES